MIRRLLPWLCLDHNFGYEKSHGVSKKLLQMLGSKSKQTLGCKTSLQGKSWSWLFFYSNDVAFHNQRFTAAATSQ